MVISHNSAFCAILLFKSLIQFEQLLSTDSDAIGIRGSGFGAVFKHSVDPNVYIHRLGVGSDNTGIRIEQSHLRQRISHGIGQVVANHIVTI